MSPPPLSAPRPGRRGSESTASRPPTCCWPNCAMPQRRTESGVDMHGYLAVRTHDTKGCMRGCARTRDGGLDMLNISRFVRLLPALALLLFAWDAQAQSFRVQ